MANTIKPTRNGVYYDLSVSPYVYDNGTFKFVFSSKLNLERFHRYLDKYKDLKVRFTIGYSKFDTEIDGTWLVFFTAYARVEKRGFMFYSYKHEKWYNNYNEVKFCVIEV